MDSVALKFLVDTVSVRHNATISTCIFILNSQFSTIFAIHSWQHHPCAGDQPKPWLKCNDCHTLVHLLTVEIALLLVVAHEDNAGSRLARSCTADLRGLAPYHLRVMSDHPAVGVDIRENAIYKIFLLLSPRVHHLGVGVTTTPALPQVFSRIREFVCAVTKAALVRNRVGPLLRRSL